MAARVPSSVSGSGWGLAARLPGWPPQVAHSTASDLGRALVEVRQEMIRRIEDGKAKRHPH